MSQIPQIRAYVGPPVVRAFLPGPVYAGQWGEAPATRDRVGRFPGQNLIAENTIIGVQYNAGTRLLSNEELWTVYRQCPEVRASIEEIVRIISTWDWNIEANVEPDHSQYDFALEVASQAQRFLEAPNTDGETWQTLISKEIRDLLIYDALAMENVLDKRGKYVELVSLAGGTITPLVDEHQRTIMYTQVVGGETSKMTTEQVVYMNLFPNTSYPGGTPLIETLLNEVIALLRASKHVMIAYDSDEVAPGVLLIAGLAGKVAERAVAGLRNMRGSDHKLRVLTSDNPKGLEARWVELRHTPKDLDMKEIIHQVRRTIWRLFGVKPVTMGDTEATPRATAEVQVTAEDSGLIRPILELLQSLVNARILPLVVGDTELAALVKFQFNLEKTLSPEQQKNLAEVDRIDFDRGIVTVNEIREKRGRSPIKEGDIPLVLSGGSYIPLASLVAGHIEGDEGESAETTSTDEDEAAPGEAETESRPVAVIARIGALLRRTGKRRPTNRSCRCGTLHKHSGGLRTRSKDELLPSDWQPAGRFAKYRTLNLVKLADELIAYRLEISPLYLRAKIDTLSAFQSALADGQIDAQEAGNLARRIADVLEKLTVDWRETSLPMYRRCSRIGRDAAVHFSGDAQVVKDWEKRGELYHQKAMAYLTDANGLISDLRYKLLTIIQASTRGTPEGEMVYRATGESDKEIFARVIAAVSHTFEANEHRISHWSGKLVELASETARDGLLEASTKGEGKTEEEPGKGDDEARTVEVWWAEWVAVNDAVTCSTCSWESSQGFRPLSGITIQPGGATECGGNCRCVLVFWTEIEVQNGSAVRLS